MTTYTICFADPTIEALAAVVNASIGCRIDASNPRYAADRVVAHSLMLDSESSKRLDLRRANLGDSHVAHG